MSVVQQPSWCLAIVLARFQHVLLCLRIHDVIPFGASRSSVLWCARTRVPVHIPALLVARCRKRDSSRRLGCFSSDRLGRVVLHRRPRRRSRRVQLLALPNATANPTHCRPLSAGTVHVYTHGFCCSCARANVFTIHGVYFKSSTSFLSCQPLSWVPRLEYSLVGCHCSTQGKMFEPS